MRADSGLEVELEADGGVDAELECHVVAGCILSRERQRGIIERHEIQRKAPFGRMAVFEGPEFEFGIESDAGDSVEGGVCESQSDFRDIVDSIAYLDVVGDIGTDGYRVGGPALQRRDAVSERSADPEVVTDEVSELRSDPEVGLGCGGLIGAEGRRGDAEDSADIHFALVLGRDDGARCNGKQCAGEELFHHGVRV